MTLDAFALPDQSEIAGEAILPVLFRERIQ